MKSLITVLALTIAVGAGYWKMKNPQGTLPDAQAQANSVLERALTQAGTGLDSLRTMLTDGQGAGAGQPTAMQDTQLSSQVADQVDSQVNQILNQQTSEADSKLTALQESTSQTTTKMEERLAALEHQLTSFSGDSQSLLADLQAQLASEAEVKQSSANDAEKALTEFSNFKTSVQAELDDLKAGNHNSSIALDSFTEKLASLDARLKTLSSATAAAGNGETEATEGNTSGSLDINKKLSAVTAQLDQRLAAMEEQLTAATSTNAQSRLDTLSADLNTTRENLSSLESALQQKITQLTQALQASNQAGSNDELLKLEQGFQQRSANLAQQIEAIQTNQEKLEENLLTLQSTVESSAIENSQNDLRQQLSNLENLVRNTPGSSPGISSISDALEQSRERIASLEQRVGNLPASTETDSAKHLQEQLQAKIAELEGRLSNTGTAASPEIVNTLSEVQQKVSALENKGFVTAEDIEERLSETKSVQYKIYFSLGGVDITADAAKVLDSMIAQEANRAIDISIFGTTDRSGSFEFNQQLALRRANKVRSYLIQNGFDFTKIRVVDGIGEDLAASISPDGINDPNQRSVIIFAFQP